MLKNGTVVHRYSQPLGARKKVDYSEGLTITRSKMRCQRYDGASKNVDYSGGLLITGLTITGDYCITMAFYAVFVLENFSCLRKQNN